MIPGEKHFPEVKDENGKVLPTSGITGSMADTVGVKNLYRYRGYRYDSETQLYYLQSRYYNPSWGRFIAADAIGRVVGELLSHNIFAYCVNNVVNLEDPSGFIPAYAGDETEETRKAAFETMNKVSKSNPTSSKKLGPEGEPNSHGLEHDKNGNLVKERWYGPDGRAVKDRHHTNHGNPKKHPKVPHDHDWGDVNGKWEPGKWYAESLRPLVGVGLVFTTSAAMVITIGNDVTGVGIADNWLVAPIGGAFRKGVIMIFGG